MRTQLAMSLMTLVMVGGCREASSSGRESRTELTGHVFYRDAQLDPDNTHHDADAPAERVRGTLRMTVHGTGELEGRCPDAADGIFVAYYDGDLRIDNDGSFRAPLYPLTPAVYTPSGCALDDLTVAVVTNVLIRAAVPATPGRCSAMCAATTRARREAACQNAADRTECRLSADTSATQACETNCVGHATAIGGEGELDNNTLLEADAAKLRDGAFGELSATIVFDHLLDDQLQAIP